MPYPRSMALPTIEQSGPAPVTGTMKLSPRLIKNVLSCFCVTPGSKVTKPNSSSKAILVNVDRSNIKVLLLGLGG